MFCYNDDDDDECCDETFHYIPYSIIIAVSTHSTCAVLRVTAMMIQK